MSPFFGRSDDMEHLVVKRLASSFMGGNARAFCGPCQTVGKAVASSWKQSFSVFVCLRRDHDVGRTSVMPMSVRKGLRGAKCLEKE